jgi:hypothetical protein
VTTRDIRPSTAITVCDVCGRTLLRGERAEAYVHGGTRRWVCELCKSRALHEGWVREGTLPDYNAAGAGTERRRSLLGRLRARREPTVEQGNGTERGIELDPTGYGEHAPADPAPRPQRRRRDPVPEPVREPRHVRAVPASPEHKTAQAIQLFNSSEHPRTVAGVARSLGLPGVAVLPVPGHTSLVNVTVSWELCWYRYEVDLSEEAASVRLAGQGYELDELPPEERAANAAASDHGTLEFSG